MLLMVFKESVYDFIYFLYCFPVFNFIDSISFYFIYLEALLRVHKHFNLLCLLVKLTFCHSMYLTLYPTIFLAFKITLSDINIAISLLFLLEFSKYIFFHLFTFNLLISWYKAQFSFILYYLI